MTNLENTFTPLATRPLPHFQLNAAAIIPR